MIKIDRNIAQRNIEDIVGSMNFTKRNYVFLKNKFITQEILVYDKNRIVTFFVRIIKKDGKLKKYCHKRCKLFVVDCALYDLIVSRIQMNEYYIADFECIKYIKNKKKLFFEDVSGNHYFKIADTDIYGFDQTKQIERVKAFADKINDMK